MSWCKFWEFAVKLHPSLNRSKVTIISDQCKGSIGAVKKHVPHAFHFHCSYHCLNNIALKCKGGKSKNSPHWVFKKLLACHNIQALDEPN